MKRNTEWSELAARLAVLDPQKHDQLLEAMRTIVESREALAEFDRALFLRRGGCSVSRRNPAVRPGAHRGDGGDDHGMQPKHDSATCALDECEDCVHEQMATQVNDDDDDECAHEHVSHADSGLPPDIAECEDCGAHIDVSPEQN